MFKLAYFLKKYRKQTLLGPLFKLAEAVLELIVPLVMIRVIDIGVKNGDAAYVYRMGGLLLLISIVSLASALVCQYMASIASQGVGTELRKTLFQKINSFSHTELDRFGTHSLITRVTNDVNQLQLAVAMLIRLVVRAPFLAVGAVIMAAFIDLKLSLVFAVVMPLIALILFVIMNRSVPFFKAMQKKLDAISLITRETLEGARVIRAFSRQERERARFEQASDELAQIAVNVGKLSALLNPLTYAVMNVGILVIIWVSGYQVYDGALTQGEIIAFVNYMTQVLLALIVVANLVVIFTKASASASRVNEILETTSSIQSQTEQPVAPRPDAPLVAFRKVSFSYPGSRETALSGLDFTIAPGETVGIIGGTGSGKSTLVNLIPRFYDATTGAVQFYGTDVRQYPLSQLRGFIGIVPQHAVLVSGSIEKNLRWGKADATEEELLSALATAQALDFVQQLPQGLKTHIEQGGKNLSGGQRQRLTIARALVGKPPLLIFDDSASALDYATDAALRKALARDIRESAVILVSQRVSTVAHADKLIVMDDGCIAGMGTHRQLLETCPVYQDICSSQHYSGEEAQDE